MVYMFFCTYTFASNPAIIDASKCSSKMGEGGNYHSKQTKLAGKCEGNALAPIIRNDRIVFSVPSQNSVIRQKSNDRTELAFTKTPIQFNKNYLIDFKVQIDPKSDITNNFYYVMQIWQSPEYSPIFGLRVDRGTKARGAFVIRNEQDHLAGKRIARVDLASKEKHYQIYLNINDNLTGKIKISENSKIIVDWDGLIGYPIENSSNKSRLLIMKFGLYKGPEPEKNFKVSFKDVALKQMD